MENVIKSFGTWHVTKDGLDHEDPHYDLSIYDVFAIKVVDGVEVWEFPIHMTHKKWMMGAESHQLQEFNQAFKFALEYFKAQRPSDRLGVSDDYTWVVQQQILDYRASKV